MTPAEEERLARVTEYVDGELSEDERRALEALMESDEALRREVDDARAARLLLGELAPRPVPRDFLRKVQRRARRNLGSRLGGPGGNPMLFGLSVEIFAIIALATMFACYFLVEWASSKAPGKLEWAPVPAPVSTPGSSVD